MKILIITPRIPYPPYRGDKLKIFNIARQLSEDNSVEILTFYRSKKDLEDTIHFSDYNIKVTTVKLTLIESLFRICLAFFSKRPFQVAWFRSVKMMRKLNELINENNYDVVYYHLIRSAQYFKPEFSGKTMNVIDFTDAVSLYLDRFAKIEQNPLKKLFIKMERARIYEYEKIAEKFHTLFICSETDKEFLLNRGIKANIRILSNAIDSNYFKPSDVSFEKERIIFTGNMPYFANYDAVLYFAKEIFPIILKDIPEAKFFIVGQKPPLKIKKLASENIIVTGFVKDIRNEYLKSAVNVAPMRFGAGTLNKVLESIALGVPVVATKMAVCGLPKELSKYVFVAENAGEFAAQTVKIMQDKSIRANLLEEGKDHIKTNFSWEKVVKDFEDYLNSEIKKIR